eukprot:13364701-Alexandrium_andersonii.AAC.1
MNNQPAHANTQAWQGDAQDKFPCACVALSSVAKRIGSTSGLGPRSGVAPILPLLRAALLVGALAAAALRAVGLVLLHLRRGPQ